MVADGQEATSAVLRPPAVEGREEVVQAGDVDVVEGVEEGPGDGADAGHDGRGGEPPGQRLAGRRGRARHGGGGGSGGYRVVVVRLAWRAAQGMAARMLGRVEYGRAREMHTRACRH